MLQHWPNVTVTMMSVLWHWWYGECALMSLLCLSWSSLIPFTWIIQKEVVSLLQGISTIALCTLTIVPWCWPLYWPLHFLFDYHFGCCAPESAYMWGLYTVKFLLELLWHSSLWHQCCGICAVMLLLWEWRQCFVIGAMLIVL